MYVNHTFKYCNRYCNVFYCNNYNNSYILGRSKEIKAISIIAN